MCQTHSKWWNLEYDFTDLTLRMCTTEFMLVLPMAQPDLLEILFDIFFVSHTHLLTRVVTKEDNMCNEIWIWMTGHINLRWFQSPFCTFIFFYFLNKNFWTRTWMCLMMKFLQEPCCWYHTVDLCQLKTINHFSEWFLMSLCKLVLPPVATPYSAVGRILYDQIKSTETRNRLLYFKRIYSLVTAIRVTWGKCEIYHGKVDFPPETLIFEVDLMHTVPLSGNKCYLPFSGECGCLYFINNVFDSNAFP